MDLSLKERFPVVTCSEAGVFKTRLPLYWIANYASWRAL